MKNEIDYLIQTIYPKMRKYCKDQFGLQFQVCFYSSCFFFLVCLCAYILVFDNDY